MVSVSSCSAQEGCCQLMALRIAMGDGREEFGHSGNAPVQPAEQRLHGQLLSFIHGQHLPVDAAVGAGHGLSLQVDPLEFLK